VSVAGGYPSNNLYPKFAVDSLAGLYRLNWIDVYSTFDNSSFAGQQVALDQRVSNVFHVSVAP